MKQEVITLEGTVDTVIYRNDDNGYAVLRVNSSSGDTVTAVGCAPHIGVGEFISASGKWVEHASYGEQFQIDTIERSLPAEEGAILDYLSSGAVKGVGRKTAEKLVSKFGKNCFYVMEQEPERLCEISGITPEKAKKISEDFAMQNGISRLMEYLVGNQVEPAIAVKLYRMYGSAAMGIVKQNPYILTDFTFGVDFYKADLMAEKLGVSAEAQSRVEAAVIYTLSYNSEAGHSFLPYGKLIEATAKMIGLDILPIENAVSSLCEDGMLKTRRIRDVDAVYLAHLYEAEEYVARKLLDMMSDFSGCGKVDSEKLINRIAREHKIEYAENQRRAIAMAAENPVMILTGGPGTGKTTVIRGMLAVFEKLGLNCALAAPTGRAAKRMSEACGTEAKTIHRMLEMNYSEGNAFPTFGKTHSEPLDCDVLIIDEMSMVDLMLMRAVTDAIRPGCRLVLVGDADQLPSVGAGNVLKDLIASDMVPTVRLEEIFRQAAESNIVVGAHQINRGEMPDLMQKDSDLFFLRKNVYTECIDTVVDLVSRRLPENMKIPASQIQVLTTNRKYEVGTAVLNRRLQQAINPPHPDKKEKRIGERVFRVGDRVMQVRNNYDRAWHGIYDGESGMGVFNGDVGEIKAIDLQSEVVTVEFDDRLVYYPFTMINELELAYAMTVHKAQGSEFRAVVFAALGGTKYLLHRSVLYTAITRAKELLIIVGDLNTVQAMVDNNKQRNRYSGLRALIGGQ